MDRLASAAIRLSSKASPSSQSPMPELALIWPTWPASARRLPQYAEMIRIARLPPPNIFRNIGAVVWPASARRLPQYSERCSAVANAQYGSFRLATRMDGNGSSSFGTGRNPNNRADLHSLPRQGG